MGFNFTSIFTETSSHAQIFSKQFTCKKSPKQLKSTKLNQPKYNLIIFKVKGAQQSWIYPSE